MPPLLISVATGLCCLCRLLLSPPHCHQLLLGLGTSSVVVILSDTDINEYYNNTSEVSKDSVNDNTIITMTILDTTMSISTNNNRYITPEYLVHLPQVRVVSFLLHYYLGG